MDHWDTLGEGENLHGSLGHPKGGRELAYISWDIPGEGEDLHLSLEHPSRGGRELSSITGTP